MENLNKIKQIFLLSLISFNLSSCGDINNPNQPRAYSPLGIINNDYLTMFYESLEKVDLKTYYAKLTLVLKNNEYSKIASIEPGHSIYKISDGYDDMYLCDYIKINDDEFYMTQNLNYSIKEKVAYRIDVKITLEKELEPRYCSTFNINFKHDDHEDSEMFMIQDF